MVFELKIYDCNCCGVIYEVELDRYILILFQCSVCFWYCDVVTVDAFIVQWVEYVWLWVVNLVDMVGWIVDVEQCI